MRFSAAAITAAAAYLPAVFSGPVAQLETGLANDHTQLLEQLTMHNASEEIISDFLQYTDCAKDKMNLESSEQSIGEECNMHHVTSAAESWNARIE